MKTFRLFFSNISISKWTLLAIIAFSLWFFNYMRIWEKDRVIIFDSAQYYGYLPITFIKHDITLSSLDKTKPSPYNELWCNVMPDGRRCIKMTMGVAFMVSPFFFIAHYAAAPWFNYPQDGYSRPYQKFFCLSSLFYVLMGFVIIRKILLKYFSEIVTSITLLVILLATNLEHYAFIAPTLSHPYSFFLFASFLYLIIKFIKQPRFWNAVLLGIVTGLISLIRPTNSIVIIIPFLFGILSFKDFKNRINFFINQYKFVIVSIISTLLIWVPQMLYWHKVTDHYLFYSYTNEVIFFSHPHIIEGLFSYRKGWLLYTPVMSFSLIGFIWLRKHSSELFLPILIITILHLYLVFSWWCWWYGGCFGGRVMVDIYSLLAFPLAAFIDFFIKRLRYGIPFFLLTVFFIYLNFFQSWQARFAIIHWDSMTKEAYWGVFLNKYCPPDYLKMLKEPNYENAQKYGEEKE